MVDRLLLNVNRLPIGQLIEFMSRRAPPVDMPHVE
jgi:hypothetical protein